MIENTIKDYPDTTRTKAYIRPLVNIVRDWGIKGCEAKARAIWYDWDIDKLPFQVLINIGGGVNQRWPNASSIDAMFDKELDFNTKPLPLGNEFVDFLICEQVIEHLHNTTWFLKELFRILKPGGRIILSTENLASLPNIFALLLGKAPFSTQALCGSFVGGWKDGPAGYPDGVKENHSTFSGVHGHVRVMTVGQIKALLQKTGFNLLRKRGFGFNHYVLFYAEKPQSK